MTEQGLDIGNWSTLESMQTWGELSQRAENSSSHQELVQFLRQTVTGKTRRVLDIGCGNGRFIPVLASLDGRYVGVDNSSLIAEAGHKYPYSPHKQEYFRRDITSGLEFLKDRQFDFIIMLFCLHFIDEFRILPLINELSKRLDVGGKMIFAGYIDKTELNEYIESCIRDSLVQVRRVKIGGYAILEGIK